MSQQYLPQYGGAPPMYNAPPPQYSPPPPFAPSQGDAIVNLPTNPNVPLDPQTDHVVNTLFGSVDKVNKTALANQFKNPMLAGALVAFMLLPISDSLVAKIMPNYMGNRSALIAAKVVITMVIFFLVSNWGFSRAK